MRDAQDVGVDSAQCSKHPAEATNASGLCVVTFPAPYSTKPIVMVCVDMAGDTSYLWKVQSWATSGGNITGCTIAVRQTRALPAVLTLLLNLISYDTTIPAPAGVGLQIKVEAAG